MGSISFWEGFEKRADLRTLGLKGLEHLVGAFKGVARFGKGIADMSQGLGDSYMSSNKLVQEVGKDLSKMTSTISGDIEKTTHSLSKNIMDVGDTVAESVKDISHNVKDTAKNVTDTTKYLKWGAGGALGLYAGSKILGMPGAVQEYRRNKNQADLAQRQLYMMSGAPR